MARTKISKVAKDLNVALPTVVDFLRSKNITVDDNPNARIEDDVVDILVKEFKSDKDQKTKSEQFSTERQQQRVKPAPAKPEEIKLPSELNKPKILGKIELDRHGNPVRHEAAAPQAEAPKAPAEKPAAPVAPAAEPVAEPQVAKVPEAPVSTPKETVPAAAAAPVQPVANPAPEKPAEKPEAKQPEKAPVAAPAVEKAPAAEKVAAVPAAAPATEQKPAPAAQPAAEAPAEEKEQEIFSVGLPKDRPTINVIGKIDLSAINQSTRPRKKSKEERRNERLSRQNGQNAGAAGSADERKKRKRIGTKEKIDIEKQGNQPGCDRGRGQGGGEGRGKNGRGGKNDHSSRRGGHTEVNEEDVQKQVKCLHASPPKTKARRRA